MYRVRFHIALVIFLLVEVSVAGGHAVGDDFQRILNLIHYDTLPVAVDQQWLVAILKHSHTV